MTSEEAVCVSFLRSRSLRAFDADQMAWVGEAIPHLQRAVQLTKRLAGVDLLLLRCPRRIELTRQPRIPPGWCREGGLPQSRRGVAG